MKLVPYGPKPTGSGKGLEGQNCNVTSCQKENSAHHYNKVMRAWYCKSCAEKIEYWAVVDGMSFFDGIEGRR